jgi:hypothetical protein
MYLFSYRQEVWEWGQSSESKVIVTIHGTFGKTTL